MLGVFTFGIAMFIMYLLGYLNLRKKIKQKERECLNKKQMIENRDILIGDLEEKIKKLEKTNYTLEKIKAIYKQEKGIVNRHDKIKELIEKSN